MKAKDLKILRKKLTRVNKAEYEPLHGISQDAFFVAPQTADDEPLTVRFARSADIVKQRELFEDLLSLFERNMGELYKKSSWGLDKGLKSAELKHANARYLLVETTTSNKENRHQLAGFVHFRFDYDDEEQPMDAVLYVWEIQIDEKFRRQGLGKRLMGIAEQIAAKAEVSKVLLTVFKYNQAAMDFYKRLDYGIDASSPSNHNEPADYEILSKSVA